MKALLAKRAGSFTDEEESFNRYFGRSANPPFKSRAEAAASPDFAKVVRRSQERWKRAPDSNAHYEYLKAREELMTNLLTVMADNKLDAIVHKAVEHQPTLIKDGLEVDGKSIMGVMMLAAAKGSAVVVHVEGADEIEAVAGIERLFADRFGEKE